jgi:triosephosphate isomerase
VTSSTNGAFDRKPFIAGNWKMNMDHVQGITLLQKLAWTLSDAKHDYSRVEVAVFPPFTDLRGVQTLVQGDDLDVAYGGQDVLVGHSERRTIHNESDDVLNAKVKAAFKHNLVPVLCVGEGLEIRQAGTHVEHTLAQLRAGVAGLSPEQAAELVVAYEPVWAIGTGEVAGPGDAQELCAAIRAELESLFGAGTAAKTRLLYGGSVKANNAAAILKERDVDGLLVGGASLDPAEFANIVRFESHLVTD